jgi:hypothetical protein
MAASSASSVAFSPSQLVNPHYLNTPGSTGQSGATPSGNVGYGAVAGVSPNSGTLLYNAAAIINDSPQSGTDNFDFDFLFAQETLERAGLSLGENDQLPL